MGKTDDAAARASRGRTAGAPPDANSKMRVHATTAFSGHPPKKALRPPDP